MHTRCMCGACMVHARGDARCMRRAQLWSYRAIVSYVSRNCLICIAQLFHVYAACAACTCSCASGNEIMIGTGSVCNMHLQPRLVGTVLQAAAAAALRPFGRCSGTAKDGTSHEPKSLASPGVKVQRWRWRM